MKSSLPFIVDAHLDLAMNAMEWNRDLRWTVEAIRNSEKHLTDKPDRGKNTVSFPSLRAGNIGLVVATQIARYSENPKLPGASWNSPEQAWAMTQAQLAWYKTMEEAGALRQITNTIELDNHLADWKINPDETPIGYILSLEGADSLIDINYLDRAHEYGLRALGPAHYGPGRYAQGTDASGGLGTQGIELLKKMESLNIILDATHLCDESFWEAMEHFNGPIWASHQNCRKLVPHNRQFTDEQLKILISRGAVIGVALDAVMLVPGWVRGKSNPVEKGVSLERVIDHIDHICQLAGNTDHVAIGSDLDGAFGTEQCPADLNTISDLQLLPQKLSKRGYFKIDIEKICSENWLRFLRKAWS
jgi:membrane dipeptidase